MDYKEIITAKVLIDEYNVKSDYPLIKNALKSDLCYKKDDRFSKFKSKEHIPFALEHIIISDVVLIEYWNNYCQNISALVDKEIKKILYDYTQDKSQESYKDEYNTSSYGLVFFGIFNENSKYSKYLSSITIKRSKVNDYCYFVTIHLGLNDNTKSVMEKVANNHFSYGTGDEVTSGFSFNFNDHGFYYYTDIIKYEVTTCLKNDGLIAMTNIDSPIYTLYTCKTDLMKCFDFEFLKLNRNSINKKIDDVLTSDTEKRALFYLISDSLFDELIIHGKIKFLSLLTCYYNLIYNILLSINDELLMIINNDLSNNKIDYNKIKGINNRYFSISRIVSNYKTSVFLMYGGLEFYCGDVQIKSETCVASVYNSMRKVKNDFDNLYKDVSKIYEINRIHDDSRNSNIMLICNIIALIVAIISLSFSIFTSKAKTANNQIIEQDFFQNEDVEFISSISEASNSTIK